MSHLLSAGHYKARLARASRKDVEASQEDLASLRLNYHAAKLEATIQKNLAEHAFTPDQILAFISAIKSGMGRVTQ